MAKDKAKSLQNTLDANSTPDVDTKTYELREDKKYHIKDGKVLKPGDTAELTDEEFASFRDKFKLVGEPSKSVPVATTVVTPTVKTDQVQDAAGRTLDPAVNPANPKNAIVVNPRAGV